MVEKQSSRKNLLSSHQSDRYSRDDDNQSEAAIVRCSGDLGEMGNNTLGRSETMIKLNLKSFSDEIDCQKSIGAKFTDLTGDVLDFISEFLSPAQE